MKSFLILIPRLVNEQEIEQVVIKKANRIKIFQIEDGIC